MQNHEVIPAFEMLLDELENVVGALNQEGAQLLTAGKYDEARALIEKAESINAIRDKIQSLSEDWQKLLVKSTEKTVRKPRKRKLKSTTLLEKGLRTPEDAFKLPLLKTLIEMGGAGRVSDVLDRMENHVKPILTDHDYEPLSSTDELRWRNTAKWARAEMVKEGLLDPNSPYGVWTITPYGNQWMNKQQNQYYSVERKRMETQTTTHLKKFNRKAKSTALQQIIEVCLEMFYNNTDATYAVKIVAKRRSLKSNSTIYDACTRKIGLSFVEFKDLTKDRPRLIQYLVKQFPDDKYIIIEQLS
jgi:restriction system protein